MKKTTPRKMTLTRETLLQLRPDQTKAAGGSIVIQQPQPLTRKLRRPHLLRLTPASVSPGRPRASLPSEPARQKRSSTARLRRAFSVRGARDWPGAHAVRALLKGEILEGLWFDRTQEYLARRRGETFDRLQYATREVLELDPLPCWKHLSEEERRRRIEALVEDIEAETTVRRKAFRDQAPGAQPPSWPKIPSGSRKRPRSPRRRLSTWLARRSVASFGTPILCSSRPTVTPPRSSGPGSATLRSRSGASRQRCRSWAVRLTLLSPT